MPEKLFIATPVYERSLTLDYHTSAIETVAACYREGDLGLPKLRLISAGWAGAEHSCSALLGDRLHAYAVHRFRHRVESGICDATALRDAGLRRYRSAGFVLPDENVPAAISGLAWHPPVQHPLVPVVEASHVPTGFLMLRRSAFERFAAAYPDLRCTFEKSGLPGAVVVLQLLSGGRQILQRGLQVLSFIPPLRWPAMGGSQNPCLNTSGITTLSAAWPIVLAPRLRQKGKI